MSSDIPRMDERWIEPDGRPTKRFFRYIQERLQVIVGMVATLSSGKIWVGSSGNLPAEQTMSGDATISVAGALTFATVNGNVGSFGDANNVSQITVNAKGLVTAAANVGITSLTIADEAADATCFPVFSTAATGAFSPKSNANLTFNSSVPSLACTTFVGALTGNASTATALQNARTIGGTSFDGTANIVPATITVANEATDTTCFPVFVTAATGDLGPKTNSNITFNSNTGVFTSALLNAGSIARGGTDSSLPIYADTHGSGYKLELFGSTHATAANDLRLWDGTNTVLLWDHSALTLTLRADLGATKFDADTIQVNANLLPDANDGAVLGAAGTAFSDLFLAEGAVINWDSGDATLTQTGNVLSLDGAAFMIGDTANATNLSGLTINQGAADDNILTLKSSDIAHALTSGGGATQETDDYFVISKQLGTQGGAFIQVTAEDDTTSQVLQIRAIGGTATTTDVTSSVGLITLVAAEHDGANATIAAPTDQNIFVVRAATGAGTYATRLLLKGDDGELHLGNTTLVALDDEDDALLVRAMQIESASSGIILTEYDNPFDSHSWLVSKGLAGAKDERGFFLFPLQSRLHTHEGAIWQGYVRQRRMEERIARLEERLALIEGNHG